MTRPCDESGCACTDFNGNAAAPFCQTCGHAQDRHVAKRAATACTRCDCAAFNGTDGSAFCVACGHSRAEHGAVGVATSRQSTSGSVSPIVIAAIGGTLIVVVIIALMITLHAGPFSTSDGAPAPAQTQQETVEAAPAGLNRVAFSRGVCPSGACPVFWSASDGTDEHPTPAKGWVDSVSPDGTGAIVHDSRGAHTVTEVVTFDPPRMRRIDSSLTLWSPDSKWLIDGTGDTSPVVTIVDAETLKPTTIALPSGETINYPTMWWSPDSRKLLVETSQSSGSGRGLALIDVSAGEATRIVPARRHEVDGASWSPDGRQFAYGVRDYAPSQDNGGDAPWTLRIQPLGESTGVDVAEGKAPLWGKTLIAFEHPEPRTYDANGYVTEHHQIWTVNPVDGATSAKAVTHFRWGSHDDYEQGPTPKAWLPDGSGLVGTLPAMESARAFIVRLDAGKLELFRSRDGSPLYTFSLVTISADGKWILADTSDFEGSGPRYELFPVAGGIGKTYMPRADSLAVSAEWNP